MTRFCLRLLAGLGLLVLLAPLAVVIVNAFNADRLLSGWGGFTTQWFEEALSDRSVRNAAVGSLQIAAAATLIAAALGTFAVAFASYAPRPLAALTESLTVTRIMIPEVIIAAGLVVLLPRFGVPFGTQAVVLGHVVWGTAFFMAIAAARRAGFDRTLEDAGRDLGASPFRVFHTIVIPDLVPGLIAGALLTFTFSFDDVVTTVFLAGPDTVTLPTEILSRIRRGIDPSINAIGVLVMLVTVVGLAAATAITGPFSLATRTETRKDDA